MTVISLEGRQALVTGSSQGIGQAIARAFIEAGASVLFHGLQSADEIDPTDRPYIQMDLTADEGPERLLKEAFRILPSLDLLVSNAGGFFDPPFEEMNGATWKRTMDLNLTAPYLLIHGFASRLISEGRGGAILIVTSTNAFQSERDSVAYDASKGALASMVRSFALDLAPYGIRVNGIAPGLIRTPLTSIWMEKRTDTLEHYARNIPLRRIGKPQDVSGAAVFLCSPAAEYITGAILTVDGGLTAQQIGPTP